MAYEVFLTDPVRNELRNSIAYISNDLSSPKAAKDLLDAFEKAIQMIGELPFAFPVHQVASQAAGEKVHFISVKRYMLFYFFDEVEQRVVCIAFLHGSQDIHNRIFQI